MSRKSTGRRPSAHERALWQKIVEDATPLKRPASRTGLRQTSTPAVAEPPKQADTGRAATASPFRIGERATPGQIRDDLSTSIEAGLKRSPVTMDSKSFRRMSRGQLQPEARIDLHGMTLAAAHPRLIGFVLEAWAQGKRLVLVITGKGKSRDEPGPIPARQGALRHEVPHWLSTPPLADAVLQIAPAHRKHGGSGAYYVYLRRRR